MTSLTKKVSKFVWGKEQVDAFETLKKVITTAPVLAHFVDEHPVFVTTDASLEGLSDILEQEDNNGKRHPIAYASRKLKGGEKNYTTTELEMSAVVFAINHFKEYLLRRKITVFSLFQLAVLSNDEKPIISYYKIYFLTLRIRSSNKTSPRLMEHG